MGALESMLASWRQHPDAELTISLCSYLSASASEALVNEVGFKAESVHGSDVDVLVAVARMYLGAGRLSDALRVFIAARSADADDWRPYRYLAEVLLRQGEATRAYSIAMKAIERGIGGKELEGWLDRARTYVEVERREGSRALASRVAAELARSNASSLQPPPFESAVEIDPDDEVEDLDDDAMLSIPDGTETSAKGRLPSFELGSDALLSIPDGDVSFEESSDEDLTNVLGKEHFESLQSFDDEATHVLDDEHTRELLEQSRRSSPAMDPFALDEDERTAVASLREVVSAAPARSATAPLPPVPAPPATARRMPSSLPPPRSRHESAVITSRPPPRGELPFFDVADDLPPPPGASRGPTSSARSAALAPMPTRAISGSRTPPPPPAPSRPPVSAPTPQRTRTLPPPPVSFGVPAASRPAPAPPKPPSPVQYAPPTQSSPRVAVPADEDSIIVAGVGRQISQSQRPPTPTLPPTRPSGRPATRAETVRISRTSTPPRRKSSGFHVTVLMLLLLGIVGGAAFLFFQNEADRRELAAERAGVKRALAWLRSGKPADLAQARSELEGRRRPMLEPYAELLVLRERMLQLVVAGDRPTDMSEAIQRARAAGASNSVLCAGQIVASLARGDLSAALTAVKQGASLGARDPYFRLLSGFTYEQLGDHQALGEYAAAYALDPGLAPAAILFARLSILEKGAAAARTDAERIASEMVDRSQGDALRSLIDVLREPGTPASSAPSVDGAALARLPVPLKPLAGLQVARKAVAIGDMDAARAAARDAAAQTASPFLLTRIAALALAARDIELPVTIAGRLEQIDSDDPTAGLLRARVALLKGDIAAAARLADRVEKADVSRVDPAALADVHGIIAYERQDRAALAAILDKASDPRSQSELSALRVGLGLMKAQVPSVDAIDALARDAAPWADLVAVDAALDLGRMDHANHLMTGWTDVLERPLHLVRTARLARYTGKLGEAASSARQAIDVGARSFDAVTEQVYALVARGAVLPAEKAVTDAERFQGLRTLPWLRVVARGIMGRALIANAALPGPDEALHLRILAAYALARAKDPRLKAYASVLQTAAPAQPDIVALAQSAR